MILKGMGDRVMKADELFILTQSWTDSLYLTNNRFVYLHILYIFRSFNLVFLHEKLIDLLRKYILSCYKKNALLIQLL